VVVPVPNQTVSGPQDPAIRPKLALFERSDFEDVFQNHPATAKAPTERSPAPLAAASKPTPAFDVEPVALADQPAPRPGILVSPGKATLLSVLLVLLLGLAFFAGLLVGRAF
jgi:hypothetical protein